MRTSSLGISLPVLASMALAAGSVSARSMIVTATAYNSVPAQTDRTPRIGACNEPVEPGTNLLAVSPDLMKAGLACGTRVSVDGFGEFVVWDRMAARWRRRIDLHMGRKVEKAEAWGEKKLRISW